MKMEASILASRAAAERAFYIIRNKCRAECCPVPVNAERKIPLCRAPLRREESKKMKPSQQVRPEIIRVIVPHETFSFNHYCKRTFLKRFPKKLNFVYQWQVLSECTGLKPFI